jgi:hypothetical protein
MALMEGSRELAGKHRPEACEVHAPDVPFCDGHAREEFTPPMVGEAFEIAIAPGIAITCLQEVHFDAVRRSRRCFSHGESPLMCRCFPAVTMVTGGRTID